MEQTKGWIALDIDGTITLDQYSVPKPVTSYLKELTLKGWRIAMSTGRTFRFASMALSEFDFPFVLLPQNGSAAIQMPEKKILFTRYLSGEMIAQIEKAYEGMKSDFVIYMGAERGDHCYFRPKRFSKEEEPVLREWQQRQKEKWEAVEDFTLKKIPSFALAKGFGSFEGLAKVVERLRKQGAFQVALIRDPCNAQKAVLLVTDKKASKGFALEELFRRFGRGSLVIAAGDDENDLSLLRVADVKIAMSHSPDDLQKIADFIAPPTEKMGIVHALKFAIANGHNKNN